MKLPLPLNSDFGRDFRGCGERERCASDVRWHRIAPARKELRNGSNKSEREPAAVPQITGADTQSKLSMTIGRTFS